MEQNQSIVFFDGICNLCNGFVQFVIKHEKHKMLKFSSLQSDFAIDFFKKNNFETKNIDSVIVYKNQRFYILSEAAFKVIQELNWPYKSLLIFSILPKFLSDFLYKLIAKIRYKIFGINNTCWVMKPELKERFL